MSRWRWLLLQFTRRLWVRATLIALLGVAAAVVASIAERFIPWDLPDNIGAEAVDNILNILASSMLAVTTFSLSVMVAAYGAATSNVTPRATKLLMQDKVTQNVLAAFIGSFLFSLVGIVLLTTGAYGERGRVVLFVVTIAVIALIVATLLRWIDHLSRLGRVGETTDRVEEAALKAIRDRLREPCLGGRPLRDPKAEVPASAVAVDASATGYVQYIDMRRLAACAQQAEGDIFVAALPGAFVGAARPLAWIAGHPAKTGADAEEEVLQAVRGSFTVAAERTFDQDPRFGVSVMTEIASRALSPATNDSGTAIDVIGRVVRLMACWAQGSEKRPDEEPAYPRVWVPPLSTADLFDDAFTLIARDGAALIEIQVRLQKALLALMQIGDEEFRACARRHSALALKRAEMAMAFEPDKTVLRDLVRDDPVLEHR